MRTIATLGVCCVIVAGLAGCRGGPSQRASEETRTQTDRAATVHARTHSRLRLEPVPGPELAPPEGLSVRLGTMRVDAPGTHRLEAETGQEQDLEERATADRAAAAVTDKVRSGLLGVYVLGAVAVLAGAVVGLFLGRPILGVALAGGGALLLVSMVAVERYPWLGAVVGLAAAAAGVWFVIDQREHTGLRTALGAVVRGVERAGRSASEAVKRAVHAEAGARAETVKREVRRVKRSEGLS